MSVLVRDCSTSCLFHSLLIQRLQGHHSKQSLNRKIQILCCLIEHIVTLDPTSHLHLHFFISFINDNGLWAALKDFFSISNLRQRSLILRSLFNTKPCYRPKCQMLTESHQRVYFNNVRLQKYQHFNYSSSKVPDPSLHYKHMSNVLWPTVSNDTFQSASLNWKRLQGYAHSQLHCLVKYLWSQNPSICENMRWHLVTQIPGLSSARLNSSF